jgi:hypothetical protein
MTSWCPPLFDESPQRHTKRLFLCASDEISGLLRQKYNTGGYVTSDYEYMAHMAWLIGSTSAAQALIREVDGVKSAWAGGDEQKTLSLVKVCAPHMISVWLGGIDGQEQLTGDARRVQYESAASGMLAIINNFVPTVPSRAAPMTARDVADAVNMDTQWTFEGPGGGPPLAYACLLLSKALEACGQPGIDWRRVALPVGSMQQLLDSNAILDPRPLAGGQGLRKVIHCLEEGVGSMRRFHRMNIEGKAQPSGRA